MSRGRTARAAARGSNNMSPCAHHFRQVTSRTLPERARLGIRIRRATAAVATATEPSQLTSHARLADDCKKLMCKLARQTIGDHRNF